MYNKFLERLLENNYKSGLSKHGIRIRKIISPVIRFMVPFVTPNSWKCLSGGFNNFLPQQRIK